MPRHDPKTWEKMGLSGGVSIFVKAGKGGNAVEGLAHAYKPRATREEAEIDGDKDRVLRIISDLKGEGVVTRMHRIDAETLTAGSHLFRGRKIRKLVASLDDETDPAKRRVLLDKLEKAIRTLMAKVAPNSKWIAVFHGDRHHLHCHIYVENWDHISERRLNINPQLLSHLNSEKWCDDFVPCKGRGRQLDPDYPQGNRSKKIGQLKVGAAARHAAAVEKAAVTIATEGAQNLANSGRLIVLGVHGNGKTRTNPVLIVDGVRFRFDRLRASGVEGLTHPEIFLPLALDPKATGRFEREARQRRKEQPLHTPKKIEGILKDGTQTTKPGKQAPRKFGAGIRNFGAEYMQQYRASRAYRGKPFSPPRLPAAHEPATGTPPADPIMPLSSAAVVDSAMYKTLIKLGWHPKVAAAMVQDQHRKFAMLRRAAEASYADCLRMAREYFKTALPVERPEREPTDDEAKKMAIDIMMDWLKWYKARAKDHPRDAFRGRRNPTKRPPKPDDGEPERG